MNNLLSNFGLVDVRMSVSDKDISVKTCQPFLWLHIIDKIRAQYWIFMNQWPILFVLQAWLPFSTLPKTPPSIPLQASGENEDKWTFHNCK